MAGLDFDEWAEKWANGELDDAKKEQYVRKQFEAKWLSASLHGFTMIPNDLLTHLDKLDITPQEFLLIANLESYRYLETSVAYPSVATLAKRMCMSRRNVPRLVARLEKKGYIKRVPRKGTSNEYVIDGLVNELDDLVNEDLDVIYKEEGLYEE